MRLSGIFLGAALMYGSLAGPGVYYQMQNESQDVRARVTGKVEVVEDINPAYRRYEITTTQGKFNTYHMQNGNQIQLGASYEFNLRGSKMSYWPPSWSRNITSVKPIAPPPAPGT